MNTISAIPVQFAVGDVVWTPRAHTRRDRIKTVTCPCCGNWKRFFFGNGDMERAVVSGMDIQVRGSGHIITYHLESGTRVDSSMVFPTLKAAKAWAKKHFKEIDKDTEKDLKKHMAAIQRGVEKIRRKKGK